MEHIWCMYNFDKNTRDKTSDDWRKWKETNGLKIEYVLGFTELFAELN